MTQTLNYLKLKSPCHRTKTSNFIRRIHLYMVGIIRLTFIVFFRIKAESKLHIWNFIFLYHIISHLRYKFLNLTNEPHELSDMEQVRPL